MSESYIIKLPDFEGPFDLLLFFIERDELNIQDIPIYKLTTDFLSYIQHLERLNIELASEFILVAATLMRIKAKMLLPRKELDEQGNEIDPRQELVQQLLEYKKYKDVVETLKTLEENRGFSLGRGNLQQEVKSLIAILEEDTELESITLMKLLKTLQKVTDRYKTRSEKIEHRIIPFKYSIEDERDKLNLLIRQKGKAAFTEIFTFCENKIHAVFVFLGMLELVQQQLISIVIGEGVNNFWLEENVQQEAA